MKKKDFLHKISIFGNYSTVPIGYPMWQSDEPQRMPQAYLFRLFAEVLGYVSKIIY